MNRVPFLNLSADWEDVAVGARERVHKVLDSQGYVLGAQTKELEASTTALLEGCPTLAVSSGSDALYLAMLALGIGPGDAVLVPSFTFFATAGAVVRAGARPVFVDLDPETFNSEAAQFDQALERECERLGDKLIHRSSGTTLKALVAVHLYGRAVNMTSLAEWAASKGLAIVEDAAQALGCSSAGKPIGTWGDVGCFSFYPTKNLGGPGDGGLVCSRHSDLATKLSRLRVHGAGGAQYQHELVGINARMAELVAAVLNEKMPHLKAWTQRRREIAARYNQGLSGLAGLIAPSIPADPTEHVWHQFTLRVEGDRDRFLKAMDERGVDTRVFYPIPLHQQLCFEEAGREAGSLAEAEAAAASVLCLPIHPHLSDAAVDQVLAALQASAQG